MNIDYSLSPSTIGELLHPGENLKRRQSDGHNAEFEVNKKFRSNSVTELEEDPVAEKSKSDDAAVSDEHGRLKRSSTNGDVYDVDVLYNVRTIVKGKTDREFFSEKPFKGLSEEIKLKVSVIEVITHIYGEYKGAGKPSQTRANFRTTPTIDFDEDFEIQTKRENLLSIPSKMIRAALDRIIDYYPSQRADGSAHHEPYRALAHHYPKLMAYYRSYDAEEASDSESKSRVNSSIDLIEHWADIPQISDKDQQAIDDHPCDKKTASHLRTLLQFITPWYKTNVLPELQLYEQKSPMATFDKLWLLFRPGDDVFVRSKINGEVEGYVVLSTEYKKADITKGTKKEAHKRLLVTVWRFAYDGVQLFRTSEEIELQQWSGEREVASLDVFPVKFLGDGRRSEERLVERGKRFFELIKEGHAFRTYLSPSSPVSYFSHFPL